MPQFKTDKEIAHLYESAVVKEADQTPEQKAKQQEYLARHDALSRKYDREDEIEVGDRYYSVYYDLDYDSEVVDHIPNRYGPGRDVYANVARIADTDVTILGYDEDKGEDFEVTMESNPELYKMIMSGLEDKVSEMEPDPSNYDDGRDYDSMRKERDDY
jgi:hypothetical protein